MTSAQVNGVSIEYESFGDGPPLLLVMGLASQMISWPDDFVHKIADRGFRVIRFDNRDIGLSTKMTSAPPSLGRALGAQLSRRFAKSEYLLADMADDAAALLVDLGIERAHVVGASMGGMIAQSIAIRHPSKVASLTSIMSNTGDRKHGKPTMSLMRKMPRFMKSTPENRITNGLAIDRLISGPMYDEADGRSLIERSLERNDDAVGTARQMMAIAASPDRTADLRRVTAPTLVVHGLVDPLVTPSGGIATSLAIKGSRLLMFPDMGHDLPRNRWDELIDAIVLNASRAVGIDAPEPARSN